LYIHKHNKFISRTETDGFGFLLFLQTCTGTTSNRTMEPHRTSRKFSYEQIKNGLFRCIPYLLLYPLMS